MSSRWVVGDTCFSKHRVRTGFRKHVEFAPVPLTHIGPGVDQVVQQSHQQTMRNMKSKNVCGSLYTSATDPPCASAVFDRSRLRPQRERDIDEHLYRCNRYTNAVIQITTVNDEECFTSFLANERW
jgi:hypothetical protein